MLLFMERTKKQHYVGAVFGCGWCIKRFYKTERLLLICFFAKLIFDYLVRRFIVFEFRELVLAAITVNDYSFIIFNCNASIIGAKRKIVSVMLQAVFINLQAFGLVPSRGLIPDKSYQRGGYPKQSSDQRHANPKN